MNAKDITVDHLKGVGSKTLQVFHQNNIYTIEDLFFTYPYRYHFLTPMNPFDVYEDQMVCFVGRIVSAVHQTYFTGHLSALTFQIDVNGKVMKAIIFNRKYLAHQLLPSHMVKVYGKYHYFKNEISISEIYPNVTNSHCEVFYHLKGITPHFMQKSIQNAVLMGARVEEYLPQIIMNRYHFEEVNQMIWTAHQPQTEEQLQNAIMRRKYEEILEFYLRLEHYSRKRKDVKRDPIAYDIKAVKEMIQTIPFELTDDQKTTCNDIFRDFKGNYPMNRLVQGDVGSGKTVVALIASYAIVTAKKQVVLMAPTEILATQHYEYFRKMLSPLGVNVSLFTGSLSKANKAIIMTNIHHGQVDVIIGTHALYYSNIEYKRLGLVIIDEQHRFGVDARNKLLGNEIVDALYLTATPIPRTLGLTLFSDLAISTIKTVRSTKQKIFTDVILETEMEPLFHRIKEELSLGHQAYIVVSAIDAMDEGSRYDIKSAETLCKLNFPKARLGILHGRMSEEDKNQTMNAFYHHEIDILLSTTVIEVGISIDNATVITILDSQNFGLAQLHQLRGRVGRGNLKGFCYLVTNDMDVKRLQVLKESDDGFYLAEMDLKQRGPGDYFGMRQSGIPSFVFADFMKDFSLFQQIRSDAISYYEERDKNPQLKKYIENVIRNIPVDQKLN